MKLKKNKFLCYNRSERGDKMKKKSHYYIGLIDGQEVKVTKFVGCCIITILVGAIIAWGAPILLVFML